MKFINLRTFSDYTLQLGVSKVSQLASRAIAQGHYGFSVTDKMSLAGFVEGYKKSKKEDTPFVLGVELNITEDRLKQHKSNPYNKIMVFAKNYEGYKNICKMLAAASTSKYHYYQPRIDLELLFSHKEGLIVSTGDIDSLIGYKFQNDTENNTDELLFKRFKDELGDDFYAEICLYDNSSKWDREIKKFIKEENTQKQFNLRLMELAEKYAVKTYISTPVFMDTKDMNFVQNTMILNSPGNDGWHLPTLFYMKSVEELESEFLAAYEMKKSDFHNLASTTNEIYIKCKNLVFGDELHLPLVKHLEHPIMSNNDALLEYEKFKDFCKNNDKPFYDLIEICSPDNAFKLNLINILWYKKLDLFENHEARLWLLKEFIVNERNGIYKFADYFNPLEDVTLYVRSIGESRGFARGSGGASIINYLLDITDLDPIHYNLIPERFNSRQRIGEFFFKCDDLNGEDAKKK